MKHYIIVIIQILLLPFSALADDNSHACFTKDAVIIGASYSSSPKQPPYRAIKATGNDPLMNIAIPGAGSPQQMQALEKFKKNNDVETIFALDLFYWKPGENCSTANQHAKELIDWAKDDKVLFLGTLPLQARNLDCVKKLNEMIRMQCKVPNCITIDYAKWANQLQLGQLKVDGKRVSKNILNRTKHLNTYGQEVTTGKILETLRAIDPKSCPKINQDHPDSPVEKIDFTSEEVDVYS